MPADLTDGYDIEDFVTFTQRQDYDILDIHFGEMEAPDEWVDYTLGSLIAIRDELMEGDLRALYIAWLAAQEWIGDYDDEEEDDDEEEGNGREREEDYDIAVPPVSPGFDKLTAAQQALAELLQMPRELLVAAGRHSKGGVASQADDFAVWVQLLSPERREDYLVRLARNEPGLSRLLVKELRELGRDKTSAPLPEGERVTYATLLKESEAIAAQLERERREQQARLERERREQAELARQRRLEDVHNHPETFWRQVEQSVERGSAVGYKDAVEFLVDLRDAANRFNEKQEFQSRFRAWVGPHLRRPAFVRRLQERGFTLPEA